MKTKIGLLLTLVLELVKQFYKLNGLLRGQISDIISKNIDELLKNEGKGTF